MHEAGKELAKTGMPAGLTVVEQKRYVYRRINGKDFRQITNTKVSQMNGCRRKDAQALVPNPSDCDREQMISLFSTNKD
jgi:hypothetical protein